MQITLEKREPLVQAIRAIHSNGWAQGTGGNFSLLVSENPLALLMSPSGADKGSLTAENLLLVDENGLKIEGEGEPSAETLLHLAIIERTDAKSVLHTHSVWNTLLSDYYFEKGFVEIQGFEMLKGLNGVKTHEHKEIVPILENSQNMSLLSEKVAELFLRTGRTLHGFLLRNHGLYTWGRDIFEARRHVEIFEFLFEVLGRKLTINSRSK